jgi:hypothetical protein
MRSKFTIFVAGVLLASNIAWAAPANPELHAQFDYMSQVLEGKLVRHFEIRDYLSPMFQDQDGRDRFLLNFVALVRRGGILDTTVRRVSWNMGEVDEVYGFATSQLRACGRWYLWIPRCVAINTEWRRVEGKWYLLPPPQIRLDPEVKKFLRRI